MAAPQVTNLAAKLLAIKPELTPTEMIALIRDGADTSDDGRRHLLNSRRSAELLESGKAALSNGSAPLEPHK
jgi:subtilisin family serine protease